MEKYIQRVAENILPLSLAGELTEAFAEWYFTEKVEDCEDANEDCELCYQENLRYLFEIKNRYTGNKLWVGSSCILKFQLQVFEDGVLLDKTDAKKKLNKIKEKMRIDACINALRTLAKNEQNDMLNNALDYYQRNKYFTPKFAAAVFWRLSKNKIDYSASFFKVSLRRDKYKRDLREMKSWQVRYIWPALSTAQRRIAEQLGHTPPGER